MIINYNLQKTLINILIIIPIVTCGQIEKQVRDDNPGLFKNQRLYHSIPNPLFKSRSHNLDFITTIPQDSILSSTLFFKTNTMEYYQEFSLNREKEIYRFTYNPDAYQGTHLQYYFIIETKNEIHGVPVNDDGKLTPVNKLLIDPVQYFKQQSRLNK
ncbi:MAG: hypothetical protein ACJZ12_01765 [Candidatus Neomarinimicrobiota bacterium]